MAPRLLDLEPIRTYHDRRYAKANSLPKALRDMGYMMIAIHPEYKCPVLGPEADYFPPVLR